MHDNTRKDFGIQCKVNLNLSTKTLLKTSYKLTIYDL